MKQVVPFPLKHFLFFTELLAIVVLFRHSVYAISLVEQTSDVFLNLPS